MLGPGMGLRAGVMPGARIAMALLAVLALAAGALSGCASTTPAPVFGWDEKAPAPEGYYRVKAGDTLSEVAERLRLDLANLARWNGLNPPYKIVSGRLLRVTPSAPGDEGSPVPAGAIGEAGDAGGASTSGKRAKEAKTAKTKMVPRSKGPTLGGSDGSARASGSALAWRWPLKGPIKQTFARGDRTRSGIRIGGRPGDRVLAAEAGSVVYSGSGLKGYGNLIIVQHNKDYLSAYGFNRRLLAREGDRVKRGQAVAEVGQAGGDWLLHFEIRRNGTAVDPLGYLPRSR